LFGVNNNQSTSFIRLLFQRNQERFSTYVVVKSSDSAKQHSSIHESSHKVTDCSRVRVIWIFLQSSRFESLPQL